MRSQQLVRLSSLFCAFARNYKLKRNKRCYGVWSAHGAYHLMALRMRTWACTTALSARTGDRHKCTQSLSNANYISHRHGFPTNARTTRTNSITICDAIPSICVCDLSMGSSSSTHAAGRSRRQCICMVRYVCVLRRVVALYRKLSSTARLTSVAYVTATPRAHRRAFLPQVERHDHKGKARRERS
jgi:hypothetical protein